MKFYDISLPISKDLPVWPGDPAVSLTPAQSILKGDQSNVTSIQMGAHTGTHIDAPYHFLEHGATVDKVPIETLIGPCLVIGSDAQSLVRKEDIRKYNLDRYSRILIKTKNSEMWAGNSRSFNANYVSLSYDAAEHLVEMNTILVGIDYLSIEAFRSDNSRVHKLLLENSIVIVEGLNLYGVQPGEYELICMPLKLQGCEGAPARVVLREAG